jgi:iron complex transport system substrate-binding protein
LAPLLGPVLYARVPSLLTLSSRALPSIPRNSYSAAIPAERLREVDPEYLIVSPCGFGLERSLVEQSALERFPWWHELQAVQNGNLAFADGNLFFNRSGMTVSRTAEIIAEILHGISFGEKTEGVHWR